VHVRTFLEETVMINDLLFRSYARYAVEQDEPLFCDGVGGGPGEGLDGEAAEVRRMIELSGMISLQCGVLEDA